MQAPCHRTAYREVLQEYGYGDEEIRGLLDKGIALQHQEK
jgi:hypothetical protein